MTVIPSFVTIGSKGISCDTQNTSIHTDVNWIRFVMRILRNLMLPVYTSTVVIVVRCVTDYTNTIV